MTIRAIAWSHVVRCKAKAAFVLIGLLVGVSAVVGFVSLADALTAEVNHKLEKYGANILITPKTENLSLTYGGLSLGGVSFDQNKINQADLAGISTIKNAANVAAVGPMTLGAVEAGGQKILLAGVDSSQAYILRPWWKISGEMPADGQALLGSEAAVKLGAAPGQAVTISGRSFPVSGVLASTGSQDDGMVFATLATAQEVLNKPGEIDLVEVAALCAGCPVDEMVAQISEKLPNAKVMAIRQVVQGRMEAVKNFKKAAYVLCALVVFAGGMVVLVTMMAGVRERTREFGILRAVGFTRGQVMRVVLLEAGLLAALAGLLGYLLGYGITWTAMGFFTKSGFVFVMPDPALFGAVFALAMVLGLLAGVLPARAAATMDPNEALRAL